MPTTRGRKSKPRRISRSRSGQPGLFVVPDQANARTASASILGEMISSIGEVGGDLLSCEDPLEAEVGCGMLLGIGAIAGSRFEDALADVIIPAVEAQASPGALAMLLLIGALDQGRCGTKASAAAERLVDLDVPRPTWAAELDSPVTGADYTRLSDSAGDMAILACSFRRSGRSHGIPLCQDLVRQG
jgi:hypothetical protein